MTAGDLVERVKSALPRDVYLRVVGKMCEDMDARIALGFVGKLRVPAGLQERLRRLAVPVFNGIVALLKIGPTENGRSKVVIFYKRQLHCHYYGVLTQSADEAGLGVTTCASCASNDPREFELPFSYYT